MCIVVSELINLIHIELLGNYKNNSPVCIGKVNTHMHADHITGTGNLKKLYPGCRSVISRSSGAKADILLNPNEKIKFGRHELIARPTPGHTNGNLNFLLILILMNN